MQNLQKLPLEKKKTDRLISHKKAISHSIFSNQPKTETFENELTKEEVKTEIIYFGY